MNIGVVLDKILPSGSGIRRLSFKFCLWIIAAYALSLCVLVLLIRIAFSGRELTEQAMNNSQRFIVHVASNAVEGKVLNKNFTQSPGDNNPMPVFDPAAPQPAGNAAPDKKDLSAVPLPALIEQTDKGVLPVAAQNGTLPWKYYARSYNTKLNTPMVAIVFTNVGLSRTLTDDVLKLPPLMTVGFSPYANDIGKLALRGRREGFESVVDLPMQTEDYPFTDPGFFGLMDDLSPDENVNRIHSILYQFPGFVGMLAPVGETMTANKDAVKPYLIELKKRGLLFLYVKTPKNAELEDMARVNQYYALGIDVVVDAEPTKGEISRQLQNLVDIAKKQGFAIGLVHSYPSTTDELSHWSESVQGQGVDLVPVTAIAKKSFQ